MKILFINGSPRKNSLSARVMREVEANFKNVSKVDWVHCYNLNIKPCIACLKCRPDKSCCLSQDDGHYVAELIRKADRLIIGSPTYFGNISGPLKTLIDRSLTAFESISSNGLEMPIPLHVGKKAAIITACNIPYPYSDNSNHGGGVIDALRIIINAGGYTEVGNIIVGEAVKVGDLTSEIKDKAKSIAELIER